MPVRVLAIFSIDVTRRETLGLRDKCEELVRAGRQRGLSVHAVFPHGTKWFDWPANRNEVKWPEQHTDPNTLRAVWFRVSGLYSKIGARTLAQYDVLWLRAMPTTPSQILLLRKAKVVGVNTLLDLPTFPYGNRNVGGVRSVFHALTDKLDFIRARYLDAIATTSAHELLWGKPTLKVSNGIKLNEQRSTIKLKTSTSGPILAVGIAQWAPVHGLDRLFEAVYAASLQSRFHFVLAGEGPLNHELNALGDRFGLSMEWVGPVHGAKRDTLLATADIGIGGLSYPDNQLSYHYSLKHRLYAAAELPFVATFRDPLWNGCDAVLSIGTDGAPIDGQRLYEFALRAKRQRREFSELLRGRVRQATWESTYAAAWTWLADQSNGRRGRR